MEIIPRSQAVDLYVLRYTVQKQADAGNWVDAISTDDSVFAAQYAEMIKANGDTINFVRIIDNFM